LQKTIEIGHIFKLGYKYSNSMGLRVLNAAGAEEPVIMGSYGIGIERILSAAVEQRHDKDGIALPPAIAPFAVVITPVNSAETTQQRAAEEIYQSCLALGLDALLDDRDERPGVKFKDADLVGIPLRITVGKKLAQGMVELVERHGKKSSDVPVADAAATVNARVAEQIKT
jgi:prolyl-tRNA synthetase